MKLFARIRRAFPMREVQVPERIAVSDAQAERALELKRQALSYQPANGFHRDIVQQRDPLPSLLRRQAG